MHKHLYIFILVISFSSCKTISIQKETQQTTTQNIMLGVIGNQKTFVLEQDYNHLALPDYNQPIKIQPSLVTFNNKAFNAFKKAKQTQSKNVDVNYIDSLKTNQPTFLKLEIADRVGVIKTLKSKTNTEVFQFLEDNNEAHVITSISIALNQDHQSAITNADEVFLETSGIKNYVLKTYKNKVLQQTIKFTDGVVFAYQTSNTCWKEDNKYQLQIVDLVESNDKCPSKSYQSAKRAKQKINYYNF